MTREARVAAAQATIFSLLDNKQKEIIEFVLSKYNETGVEELIITGNIPRKQAPPQSSLEITDAATIGLNHDLRDFRISMFNPTSLVRVGRLLLNGVFIYRPLADA